MFGWRLNESEQRSIIYAAGPLATASFCSLQTLLTTALYNYNIIPSWMATAIKTLALFHLRSELMYALFSYINLDSGDFGLIAKNDSTHLLLVSIALSGITFLSFIGSTRTEVAYFLSSLFIRILMMPAVLDVS